MSSLWVVCLLAVVLNVSQAAFLSRIYNANVALNNKKSNDKLLGEYNARSVCECSMLCQKNYGFFGYNDKLNKCRIHQKNFSTEISEEDGWRYYSRSLFPFDCKEFHENGHTNSGIYEIYPYGSSSRPVRVYCDMETMEGGWTAIQKRVIGSVTFEKNWTEYKNGFGEPEGDVWIGNDVIHQLTEGRTSYLYVAITLLNGTRLCQVYGRFSVSNEAGMYKLLLTWNINGTLGDAMIVSGSSFKGLSGMYFSTPDRDHDRWGGGSCAVDNRGGWWYNFCHRAFLNGPWSPEYWYSPWFPKVTLGKQVRETWMLVKRH